MSGRRSTSSQVHGQASETLEQLLYALESANAGDYSVRLPDGEKGLLGDIARSFNTLMTTRSRSTTDPLRLLLADALRSVKRGDFSVRIPQDSHPSEITDLCADFNEIIGMNEMLANEIVRIGRIVGRDGQMTERASIGPVAGSWETSVESLNSLIEDLVQPNSEVARVISAVADGDLSQKMALEIDGTPIKGEFLRIGTTVNTMVDQLSSFASEVTRVAREVGTEGKLGGQAEVRGVAGTWKDLTDNVNQLAGNLTAQVRAIAEVSTAVTKGDFTRSIAVEARGEVAELKGNINQMISNLKDTTQKATQQDWLKTNLAKFTGMMQGQRHLATISRLLISELTPLVSALYGAFYVMDSENDVPFLRLVSSYAFKDRKQVGNRILIGEGLVGQCAVDKKSILLTKVPPEYLQISGGLGESASLNLIVLPVLFEGEVKAAIELASFLPFSQIHQTFLNQLMESVGVGLHMISANMRTHELLGELKRFNAELAAQAKALRESNRELEQADRYKDEFLSIISHELRTPLNLIIGFTSELDDTTGDLLTQEQHRSIVKILEGADNLLALINDLLDMSRIVAGKFTISRQTLEFPGLVQNVVERLVPVTEDKGQHLVIEVPENLPLISVDDMRICQVLLKLIGNAASSRRQGERSGSGPMSMESFCAARSRTTA